jgi:N-acyl-D-aspartate/D-glutamate deacylase
VVDSARSAGVDITIDTYPYTAANTYSYVLFPAWALDGGVEALRLRLRDSSLRTRLLSDMTNILMQDETGDDFSRIQFAQLRADTTFNGKTLLDYMKAHQYPDTMAGGLQAIIDLEIKGGFLAIYHEMSEDDVVDILRASYTMIETDGDLVEKGSEAWPHPRSFGAFPRVIARYVRELKVLTLEEAVKKMTSMPADQLRQADLGRLKEGAWADIIIFDQDRIRDVATYLQPKELSEGIDDMIISGQLVIDEGQLTGATPGRWIRN